MDLRFPWDPLARPAPTHSRTQPDPVPGRRRLDHHAALASTDRSDPWLANTLQITGPETTLTAFQQAARGPGVAPWAFDADRLEEDILLMLLADHTRSLTLPGCRVLARQFRDRAEARHQHTLSLIGTDQRCALDLHALLPVPPEILCLGHDDPRAQTWLKTHWGITHALRQVTLMPAGSPPGSPRRRSSKAGKDRCCYGFYTQTTSPQPAIDTLRKEWPDLTLVLTSRIGF
ncbi:hypothetical protein [Asaia astilbis]|uniref:hypothetical protein n=1 Tax=Asaia astilbis TaxID=610244 RepID=UPI00046F8EEE|nr:hypothetical protein [Asaia astilbis]